MAARNHIRNVLFDILRQLESGNSSSDTLDHVQYRIDCLYEIILGCFDIGFVDERVVTVVVEALDRLKLNDNDVMYKAGKVFTGSSGRPRYDISREQLEFLVQKRFSTAEGFTRLKEHGCVLPFLSWRSRNLIIALWRWTAATSRTIIVASEKCA